MLKIIRNAIKICEQTILPKFQTLDPPPRPHPHFGQKSKPWFCLGLPKTRYLRNFFRYRNISQGENNIGKLGKHFYSRYKDMSQGKGNMSVRCQTRGKIYKRPFQWGEANAIIDTQHTQSSNSEKCKRNTQDLFSWGRQTQ